jgi:hypothetical protein
MVLLAAFLFTWTSVFAEISQESFFLQQRGVMLSQLEFEKNLELLVVDPSNCSVPLKKEDRLRVLRRNTQEIRERGFLKDCRSRRVIGSRAIIENLRRQRAHVENIQTYRAQGEGITATLSTSGGTDAPPVQEILVPEDNSYQREPDQVQNFGTRPSPFDIYPGYEGLPYMSSSQSDDTLYYFDPRPYYPSIFSSRELPPGLTIGDSMKGVIVGIPRKSGFYSPTMKVGTAPQNFKFKGPVKFKIYPRPKFTILNPLQRLSQSIIRFRQDYLPFLKVKFSPMLNDRPLTGAYSQGVRTLHGMRSGKMYFEVKVLETGSDGAVGIDIGNSHNGGAINTGKKYGFEFRQQYPDYSKPNNTQFKKIQKDDIMMVAYDVDTANLWFGVNGKWLKRGPSDVVDPAKGLKPYSSSDELLRTAGIKPGDMTRAFVQGTNGTEFITNFGDQPWTYNPPDGFSGIRVTELDKKFPNLWDSNSTSATAAMDDAGGGNFYGTGVQSLDLFVLGSGGDAVVSMSPKSSGRWQFEIDGYSYPERTSMGIAPVNFQTDKLVRIGAAGTNSIGLRRQDEFFTKTGKGVIDVNGKTTYIDHFSSDTRFTFDCDFDNKTVTIYADGKEIFKTPLPPHSGAWVIAASMASTNATIYTQLPGQGIVPKAEMKFPVPGVKPWLLDDSPCPNCASRPAVLEEDKVIECASVDFVKDGSVYDGSSNTPHCTLPKTQAGMTGQCTIPPKLFACEKSNTGWFCSQYMDNYSTEERCISECRIPEVLLKKECLSTGTWETGVR